MDWKEVKKEIEADFTLEDFEEINSEMKKIKDNLENKQVIVKTHYRIFYYEFF